MTLQAWTMDPKERWGNHMAKIREGKRTREVINLIAVQHCHDPSLVHSGNAESCRTVLISPNQFLCFALLSLSTDVCDRSELSLSEPVHAGWAFVCFSLVIIRERSYPEKM